jgi:hypothetical protein
MASKDEEVARLTFVDMRGFVERRLGTDNWATLYRFDDINSPDIRVTYFCALVEPDYVDQALSNTDWDLTIGRGGPGFDGFGEGYR